MATRKIKNLDWDLVKLQEAIEAAEESLKQADSSINAMIRERGTIAIHVQHLWNMRHRIKQQIADGYIR